MDEPFDELMGPPPINSKSRNIQTSADDLYSPSIVTPEPSPTEAEQTYSRQSTRSSGGAPPSNAFGPPSGAFSHSSGPPSNAFAQEISGSPATDRWNQFEMDDEQLREESAMATGNAVVAAANRAAMREASRPTDDEFGPPTRIPYRDDPLDNAGASLPHPDEYRASTGTTSSSRGAGAKEILRSLGSGGAARRTFGGQSRYRDEVEVESEEEVVYDDPHDRVRAEALKMLELADGQASQSSGVHRSPSMDSGSPGRSTRRVPAALSGLDAMKSSNRNLTKSRFRDDPFSITSDDENEYDGDLVDVVARERGQVRDMNDANATGDKDGKSWSSRYSVSSTLENLQAKQDHTRFVNSSRMENSPPKEARSFGKGFSFTRSGNQSEYGRHSKPSAFKNLHNTVWMDADGSGNLSPTGKQTWQSNLNEKRTRRRRWVILIVILFIVGVIMTAIFSSRNKKNDGILYSGNGNGVGTRIAFYVTADTPWDEKEDKKLNGDLTALPGDAEFIVHLGNIQDAAVTLCPSSVYDDAYTVLSDSPVPVFVVPGQHDWNNCPNPENSMRDWKNNFVGFESTFDYSFATDHQLGRTENFAFVRRGVLFIGLHLVGGRVHDKDEWKKRHTDNVEWAEEKLNEDPDSYRAVVLLGNARPSQQQEDFFREVIDDVQKLGKPSVYLHANGGGGFMEYKPFDDVDNMLAVQLDDGGKSPPLRVNVNFGSRPFEIGGSV
mmetsp:Transcript_3631/g.4043  ORF Transcript_3631/g.4043 Transcript_3631/m.4043 type:complete len:722 (+) Transcript_3631:55-2220(+)|eukprot:CAMPEP_0195291342 /NCGR_PEP_ID=MMETSP0707-20130614/7716_1 /TAXON_ID=33640 /ORGANISM="Asterionellopsis glacialis, Strain CCMP134" /LENGTH=721 /DNA_ID=CAMNT_0040351647 /DNA_START=55 /DNA_END=2220 /DNA_ORIENTATION=-